MTSGVSQRTWLIGKQKMKKTNRELNTEHTKKELMRVRPKQPAYDFEPLQAVINQWVRERLNTST